MVVKAYQSFFLSKKGALSFGIFWMKSHSTISLLLSDGDKTVSFFCMSAMTYLRAHHVYSVCSHVYIYIYRQTCVYMCRILFNRFCLLPTLSHENETVLSRNRHGNKKICCIYVLCKSIYHSCIILSF